MSWDATLHDTSGHVYGDWNYTHNCNGMIAAALRESPHAKSIEHVLVGRSWWDGLNGLSGKAGGQLLTVAIDQLEADPDRFRAMNPANGWGDYESLVVVLQDMRDAVPDHPTIWQVSG